MAFLAPVAGFLVEAAFALGAPISIGTALVGAAALVGFGAKAAYDYVLDSMIEDIAVDTMGGRTVTRKEPTASRKIVYGTVRTGGTIVYQSNSGTQNQYLHNFVVFSEGEVDEITEIYFDEVKAMGLVSGNVRYYNKYSSNTDGSASNIGNKVRIAVRYGALAEQAYYSSVDPDADIPSQWTANHDLSKVAYAYIRLEYSDDIYTNGFPNISAIIKGKHQYDPRQDDTATDYSGSGSQRVDNPSTWEYSNNSAVCLLNYMLDDRIGLGESLDAFDATSLLASMNDCDVDISLAAGGTQKKYTCDGIIDSKNSHKANIQNILTSMNGQLLYSGGKYHIKSYKYETPHTQVVTEDMILGNIDITTKASRRSLYNRVKGKFVSEEENYVMTEYPVQIYYTSGTTTKQFEIDDGEILYHEYNLPMTTDNVRAQRLARLTMLRSRMQSAIKFTTNAKGLLYTVGDNIKVTNSTIGITEKIYQIQRLNVRPDVEKGLTVDIEAKENVDSFYNWSTTDELSFTSGLTVNLYEGKPNPVTLANSYPNATDFPNQIYVYWVQPENRGNCSTRVQVSFPDNPSLSGFDETVFIEAGANGELFFPFSYQQAGKRYEIIWTVIDEATRNKSDQLISYGYIGQYKTGTTGITVEGTIADPTPQQLADIVEQAGLTISPDQQINYILLDANGNFINSQEYDFVNDIIKVQQINTSRQTIESASQENLMSNGTFDYHSNDSAFWITSGSNVEITGNKLVFTNAGEDDYAFYKLPDISNSIRIIPNNKYKIKFEGSSAQNLDNFNLKIYEDFSTTGNLVPYEVTKNINLVSQNTFFTESHIPTTSIIILFISGNAGSTTSLSLDNFQVTPFNDEAIHKINIVAEQGYTPVFTAELVETRGTNPQHHTLTLTGFDGQPQNIVSLELTRPSNQVGETILTYDIKATYSQDVTSSSGTTTLVSEHIERVILRVEVI